MLAGCKGCVRTRDRRTLKILQSAVRALARPSVTMAPSSPPSYLLPRALQDKRKRKCNGSFSDRALRVRHTHWRGLLYTEPRKPSVCLRHSVRRTTGASWIGIWPMGNGLRGEGSDVLRFTPSSSLGLSLGRVTVCPSCDRSSTVLY